MKIAKCCLVSAIVILTIGCTNPLGNTNADSSFHPGLAQFCHSSYIDTVMNSFPVSYWRLGELIGSSAVDASGNTNTGTFSGGYTMGQIGALIGDGDTSVNFDGTGKVSVSDSVSLDLAGSFTVSVWVKYTDVVGYGFIVSKSLGGSFGYELFRQTGSGILRCSIGDAVGSAADPYFDILTPGGFNDGNWHHVACVYNQGVKAYIYVDGVLSVTSANNPSAAVLNSIAPLYLGARGGAGTLKFKGSIDEVAIFNTALSTAQIQALANPITSQACGFKAQ